MEQMNVALVTGSRKGLGRYLAEQLLKQGYQVVGCSREPADWTDENYWHLCADVSDEAQVQQLLGQIRQRFGRLDVAINNAGIASMNHALLIPVSTLDQLMAINLRGTFLVSRESARLMRRQRAGRIVNLTTVAVPLALEGESVYVASKSAVESLTRVMSRELAPFGITVNALGPTPIETDLIRSVPRAKIDTILAQLALKRLGQPADVFNVVDFFLRPESNYITGQIIYLGGA